ncbi:hypothetical protein BGZ97_001856 [Linnemannia gamsii]|uniref:Uncharacterized protein n=1 Tax=Linnemannia gamsii TaxID=64522 RepID=A0A9P6QVZ4_9FUNG|nr:hypothetical protein BGZ97_001856 [Linnemannia gamsii]
MKVQAVSLLLPLAVLLTQVADANRARSADPNITHEGFALSISGTYKGSIPILPVRVGQPILSPDREFTVTHGDANAPALKLTWRGQKFAFANINDMRANMTDKVYTFEHDYWFCIKV